MSLRLTLIEVRLADDMSFEKRSRQTNHRDFWPPSVNLLIINTSKSTLDILKQALCLCSAKVIPLPRLAQTSFITSLEGRAGLWMSEQHKGSGVLLIHHVLQLSFELGCRSIIT